MQPSKPCPITQCIASMAPWALMCRTHWAMVPRPMQEAVNHYFRSRRGGPSHLKACRQAIEAVLKQLADEEQQRMATRKPYGD